MQVSAAHIAVAIVAACGVTGAAPEAVFQPSRGNIRTRTIAAAGAASALGLRSVDAARLFQVQAVTLAPSMLQTRKIGADCLLAVAEALRTHGLAPDAAPPPEPRRSPRKAAGAVKSAGRGAAAGGETAPAHKPAKASAKPARAPVPDPAPEPPLEKPVFQPPARLRAIGRDAPAPDRARRTNPVRPGAATRLKPMTAAIAGFARRFPSTHWTTDEIADLFDVHPDALADWLAADQRMGRAA